MNAPTSERLRAALRRVPSIEDGRFEGLAVLPAGVTNENYVLTSPELGRLRIRLTGQHPHDGIFRDSEYAVLDAAEGRVLPRVLYRDREVLITVFIEGRNPTPEDLRDDRILRQVVDAIRFFHELPPVPDRIDAIELTRDFVRQGAARAPLPKRILGAMKGLDRLESLLDGYGIPAVCSHNDLGLSNLLVTADGVRILDTECTAMSSPYRDLAKIMSHGGLEASDRDLVLGRYQSDYGAREMHCLKIQEAVEVLLTAAWSLALRPSEEQRYTERFLDMVSALDLS